MNTDFPRLLQSFFTDYLIRQRQASPHTIASYRDTFRLLLAFARQHLKKAPSKIAVEDVDTSFIGEFLDHLEKDRGNAARSRNIRLAAIHSFFKYVAMHEPCYAALAQRVLSIPPKRYNRNPVEFLTRPEIDALIAVPDRDAWAGRRDRTLLLVAVQTGLRVSELTGLRRQDVILDTGAHIRCMGKGRKERCTPLRKEAVAALLAWMRELDDNPATPLFPNARGGHLGRDGIAYLLSKHLTVAAKQCPSLKRKRVTPHVLRHSAAMDMMMHGVDRSVIALWLGHESRDTTQMYLHANLELKEKALAKSSPLNIKPGRFKPDDQLLAFLESL